MKRFAGSLLAVVVAAALWGGGAQARARVAAQPAGVTVTKDGLVVDANAGTQTSSGTGAGQARAAAAGSGQDSYTGTQALAAGVPLTLTVLDADDLYYTRGTQPLIIAQAGQRFHNVHVLDPRALVEPKLGSAFQKIPLDKEHQALELYQDLSDGTWFLWVQYDTSDQVQFLIYQQVAQ